MSLEFSKPETLKYYVARSLDGAVVHAGFVTPDQVVTTGQPELVGSDNENDHLLALAPNAGKFPALPDMGEECVAGTIYNHGGTLLITRKTHDRTEHDVSTIPALFVIYQAEGDGYLDWIAGESLAKGVIRRDPIDSGLYITIQPMPLTITGQEPSKVPANWQPFVPSGDVWTDSGETVVALIGAGVIRVTDTAPFGATQPIRINGTEATVSSIFTPGVNGIIVISPHIPVSGGEVIEILQ